MIRRIQWCRRDGAVCSGCSAKSRFPGDRLFKGKHHNSLGYTVFRINEIIGGVRLGAWDPWLPSGMSYKFYIAVNNHRMPILA